MQSIKKEILNGVATITLLRPDVYNSFNREMALQMHEAIDECQIDDEVRCIVITGAGKAFCAGQDLNEVIDPEGPEIVKIVGEHYNPIIKRIRKIEKPFIAAVNGVAAGAGANIALACDIVIAKESASFIQAFSKIGLIPDSGGTFFLPRLIGWQRASALTILGDKVMAPQAEQMGMIYKSVADDEFDDYIADPESGQPIALDRSDEDLPNLPRSAFSLGVQYQWQSSVGSWLARVDAFYRDELYWGFDALTWDLPLARKSATTESYTVYNARLNWRITDEL